MSKRNQSQPAYKVKLEKNARIKMRDGVQLAADIFRPAAPGKYPALLAMCPYSKERQGLNVAPQPFNTPLFDGTIEAGNSEYFVSRGYVHVIVDVRGTGLSEGEYWNMLSTKEQQDGYDLVEWIARQEWCNGNVGMVGISYFAVIQYLVAAQQPPHLKAIFPLEGWTDLYRDITYQGGILNYGFYYPYLWDMIAATNTISAMAKTTPPEKLERLVKEVTQNADINTNGYLYFILTNPQKNPLLFDYMLNPNDGPFYWERAAYTKFDKIKIPTFLACGWEYFNLHLPGAFDGYQGINAPKKIYIATASPCERPWYEYHDLILRWYDYWLKGIDNGIMDEPPVKIFVMGKNEWRYEQEWPLARTKWTKFYLSSWERLVPESEVNYSQPLPPAEPDCFVHQPPSVTRANQSVKYITSPFSEDMEVTGPLALYLHAAIDTDDTNWIVALKDVDAGGSEVELTRGWLRASHMALDPAKSKPWQPYHKHTESIPVPEGEICQYAIAIQPTSNVFKAHHRLKLEIASCDSNGMWGWGCKDRPGSDPRWQHIPSARITLHKIYHDKQHPSYLLVPLIPSKEGKS